MHLFLDLVSGTVFLDPNTLSFSLNMDAALPLVAFIFNYDFISLSKFSLLTISSASTMLRSRSSIFLSYDSLNLFNVAFSFWRFSNSFSLAEVIFTDTLPMQAYLTDSNSVSSSTLLIFVLE